MRKVIILGLVLLCFYSQAQVEKTNVNRVETKAVTREVADLNTEIFLLDRNSILYLEFAEKVGISNDELLVLEELLIYPNPNDGFFTIRFKEEPDALVDVFVYDLTGNLMFKDQIIGEETLYEQEVDISNRPKGIYFLLLKQGSSSQTRKIEKL